MAFNKITETDLAGLGVTGMPDVPGLTAAEMQQKFDELPRYTAERLNKLMDELAGALAAAGIGTEGGPLQQVLDELDAAVKVKADSGEVLKKQGTDPYEPTTPYSPATKKYVDDTLVTIGAGDMQKYVYDADGSGVVDNAERLGGMLPDHFATAAALAETNTAVAETSEELAGVKTTADAAMPKSGGTFTGDVKAYGGNREGSCLRNIIVKNATDSSAISTNLIKMVRK